MAQARSDGLIDWVGRVALGIISIAIAGSILVTTTFIYGVAMAATAIVEVFDCLIVAFKKTDTDEQ